MENMNPETSKKNTFSGFFLKIPSRHFRQNKFSLQFTGKKNYIGAFLERKFSLSRESLEGRRGNVGQMFVLFINVHDLNTKVAFFSWKCHGCAPTSRNVTIYFIYRSYQHHEQHLSFLLYLATKLFFYESWKLS